MRQSDSVPELGQIVRVLQGRDAGKFAVVIRRLDERYVWIADGEKRNFDSPKRKNIRHLECLPYVSSVIQESLEETGRVTNGKLRFTLNKCKEEIDTIQEKGELNHGQGRCDRNGRHGD